jgi:putative membrane protein
MRVGKWMDRKQDGEVWKGLLAGVAGGLVASWTMDEFQFAWNKLSERIKESKNASHQQGSRNTSENDLRQSSDDEQDPATAKLASKLSEDLLGHKLAKEEKEVAGTAVHYAFGAASGGLYGAAAEVMPSVTTCEGLLYGAALWLVADEVAVPLLGLSKRPTEYPLSVHAYALASHLVYGITLNSVRRAVRSALD